CASYSVVLAGCGLRSRRVSAHDPATTVIYTLSLHDALPILRNPKYFSPPPAVRRRARRIPGFRSGWAAPDAARACEWRHRNATPRTHASTVYPAPPGIRFAHRAAATWNKYAYRKDYRADISR